MDRTERSIEMVFRARFIARSLPMVATARRHTGILTLVAIVIADRATDAERFFVFNQRVAAGVERLLACGFSMELTADSLFDRSLFQGSSFFSGRTDVVAIAPGAGVSLQLLWRR